MHIWTQSKLPWLQLSDAVPSFETYYDRDKDWSAEGLARHHSSSFWDGCGMSDQVTWMEGGCGALRYALKAAPMIVHACHCTDCQTISGGAFVINAWIERTQVELLSGVSASYRFADEIRDNRVFFCPQCGTYVWTEYMKGFYFVRVGTLDDPTLLVPDMRIWTRSKQPWLPLSKGVQVFEEYYDKDKEWPADSLAHLAANAA